MGWVSTLRRMAAQHTLLINDAIRHKGVAMPEDGGQTRGGLAANGALHVAQALAHRAQRLHRHQLRPAWDMISLSPLLKDFESKGKYVQLSAVEDTNLVEDTKWPAGCQQTPLDLFKRAAPLKPQASMDRRRFSVPAGQTLLPRRWPPPRWCALSPPGPSGGPPARPGPAAVAAAHQHLHARSAPATSQPLLQVLS